MTTEQMIAANVSFGHTLKDAKLIAALCDKAHHAGTDEEFRAALDDIAHINRALSNAN